MTALATRFHVGAGTHIGPVTVFPVWSQDRSSQTYTTTAPKGLEINELESAEVGTMTVANLSKSTVLIPEGTIVYGGLQTRVLTTDVLLGAGDRNLLDVRCVERGRWGSKVATAFAGRAPLSVIGALRGLTPTSNRRHYADQGDVWRRVTRYEKTFGSRRTSSLESIKNFRMEDRIFSEVEELNTRNDKNAQLAESVMNNLRALAANPLPGQNGVMIGLSGHPVLFEVFSSEGAFREQFASILEAIALDAPHATGEPTPSRRAIRFAECIMDQAMEQSEFSQTVLSGTSDILNTRSLLARQEDSILHTLAVNARHELVKAA